MLTNTITHEDYADERESARYGWAWPEADMCGRQVAIDQKMAEIAR